MKRLIALSVLLLLLCGCQAKDRTQTAYYFDTVITITLPYDADPALFDRAWAVCQTYDTALDRFSKGSELAQLLPYTPTVVSQETAELIATALTLSQKTNGAFDIRLGDLSDLWKADTLPDADTIARALAVAQTTSVEVTDNRITLNGTGSLDLGGIAKGYVTDRLADLFREAGCDSAILNLGGNVYCLGDKKGKPFSVGIDTLMEREDTPVLKLTNQAAVTAGVTQRYREIDGVRYHHILDPQTGRPAETDLISATIVADSATLADALSTACIVLGQEKAAELLKEFHGVSAVLVRTDGSIFLVGNPPFVQNV